MDAGRGVICRGPEGPHPGLDYWWGVDVEGLPSTADLLQEDVFLRFLASQKSKDLDRGLVKDIADHDITCDPSEGCDQLTVFSTLTQTPITVANNIWEDPYGDLSEQTLLENGVTR